MEKRVEMNWLLSFYGALLTDHRRDIAQMYLEEDLSLQEIADELCITRQGVHDALARAERQLLSCEAKLGLLKRFQALSRAVETCKRELADAEGENARRALDAIKDIEIF